MDVETEQKRAWWTTWPATLVFSLFWAFVVVTQLAMHWQEPIRVAGAVLAAFPMVFFAVPTVKRYRAWNGARRSAQM